MIQPNQVFCSSIIVFTFCGYIHGVPWNFTHSPGNSKDKISDQLKFTNQHMNKRQVLKTRHRAKLSSRYIAKAKPKKMSGKASELDDKIAFLRENLLNLIQNHNDAVPVSKHGANKSHLHGINGNSHLSLVASRYHKSKLSPSNAIVASHKKCRYLEILIAC